MLTYNEEKVLPITLPSAISQGYPIVCSDNESTDSTRNILDFYSIPWVTAAHTSDKVKSISEGRKAVLSLVDTEYVFFLDADVKLPETAVTQAYCYLLENPKVGCVCVAYSDWHVKIGASILRTEHAKSYDWLPINDCECKFMAKHLASMGLDMVNLPGMVSEHWKKGEKLWG